MSRWSVEGNYVMACNCDYGCPCNFNARPTPGNCEGIMSFAVDRGEYEGTKLDGLNSAVLAIWPGAIYEGNGDAVLFIDSRGDDKQREAMAKIFSGDVGGPMEIFRRTWKNLAGPQVAGVEIDRSGKDTVIRIEGVGQVSFDSIKNPVSGADAFPRVVLPQGLLTHELEQFTTRQFDVSGNGIVLKYPGKTAQIAKIEWQVA